MNLNKYTEARKAVGLTHEEVADKLEITRQCLYNKIENDTLTIVEVRALILHGSSVEPEKVEQKQNTNV